MLFVSNGPISGSENENDGMGIAGTLAYPSVADGASLPQVAPSANPRATAGLISDRRLIVFAFA